jgi:dUTP pyrophosphatase
MHLLYKKLSPAAVEPFRAHRRDAGFDLTSVRMRLGDNGVVIHETDIAVAIPPGYVGILKERSSIRKHSQTLVGGVIDCGYVGPIEVSFQKFDHTQSEYKVGDRVCQLVVVPLAEFDGVKERDSLPMLGDRGTQGFGSSGN